MKQTNIVRNTIENGSRLTRLKSRIVSASSRVWLVFAPILLVVFGLFGVNENAWATWPTYSGSCSTSGYVVYDASLELNTIDAEEINLAGPGYEITFEAKHTLTGAGDLKVAQYVDGNWSDAMWSDNPGEKKQGVEWKTGKWGIPYPSYYDYWDYKSYTVSTKLNPRATKIKFYTEVGATLYKTVQNIRVTRYSDNAYTLYTGPLDCGSADYNSSNSSSNHTTGTAYVDWSHKSTAPSCTITGDDSEYFYVKSTSNPPSNNNYGAMSVEVAYKHTAPGDHSATLNVGGKTITIKGHTNKITPYIVTTPTVDTITYGQKINDSQLGTGLVKADLINAAGTVVSGTWTIDEKGQTVTTSGGSNATVHLTFAPADVNTYDTIHTTATMFVRSVATISWASAYSAEEPTVPVGKWIENAATTNAAGAVITYSSTSSNVEISADGHSFRFTAEDEAEVVASHGVTATHGSASETKTFKSTYKAIQVIKWADRFDRLTTEMTSKSLIAEVWIENALTGVRTYSAERTALLQYSSANSSVVSIPVNSTTLHIEGKGTTTITAVVEGDEYYEGASVTMPVKVREPSDGCDYPLWEKDHEGDKDHLYEFFQMNKDEIISPEYDIRMEGQYPDKLSFGHKGEYYNVVGISFWKYYSGPIKAQQKIGNNWQDVQGSVVTPAISDWGETSDLQLDERATHIRFVRPQGGEGHHYIKNVTVSRKHFIRTETPEVDFGNTIKVNSSEYRDVVINYANVQDVLKVTNPFSKDVTVDDDIDVDSCGASGSAVLRIYFSPTSLATVDDYITIKDPVVGNSSALSIRVKADVQRADQTITWNPATNISTIDQILLNGTTNGQEYGQMNVIGYEVTNNDGVISVTNNVVTILKPGTVTITASQPGTTNYDVAEPVEKNFTISAEPLTLVAPTASDITYGQALPTLIGGSAKDSKGNDVDGTFAWQNPDAVLNAGDNQTPTVVFTPSTNAAWYTNLTTTANINVAKADPVVTVENVSFAYGTKAEEVALDGTGDGEWSWTDSRKDDVLAAGEYEMDVHFAPTDGDNYNAIDTKITLTVNKANPAATVENVSFAYGTKAEDVSLSGTGAGTWTWTDSRKDQVLAVGEYEMDVHFAPTDGDNYNAIDIKITLTVNKIETLQVPVVLSFCAGGSEEYRGVTYTEAGTYPVNVTGANRDTVYNVIVTVLQPTTGTDSKTITYGDNESWHGTDLSGYTAGEHEVEYHTTNAVGCDSTVTLSLTVNKATPTLSWETAPAELAYNATDVVYAATSTSNEGDITYSITSGSEYAEINANTGALTNIVPGHNITVQATQAVSTNYNAPVAITVNVTIAAAPSAPTFNNVAGDNDWQNADNWSNGEVPSGENPNVIISGELIINEDVTVGGLTILPTGSVAVVTNGTLTIKGTSESRSEYGDMHVADDGNVVLGSSADLKVRHFFLDAKLGDSSTQAASGQVKGNGALNVIGDAYFQMKFDPSGAITYGWYDFVVPFEVNTSDGIYRVEANDDLTPMTSGVDFLVQSFSEARCAAGQKAWTNFSGTMMPGQGYTITFNYQPSFNQNTFLFKKKAGATIGGSNTYSAVRTFSGEESEQGWNVLGNGTLQHIELAENLKIQIFEHASNSYQPFVATEKTIAVGTSFQVQVFDAQKTIVMSTATDRPILAPKREVREVEEFRLSLTAEGEEKEADRLWISASEEATGAYWIGHDLLKKGTMTGAKVARMWCTRNGKQLCDVEMPMVNGSAENALGLFTPNAGQYTLAIEEAPADASLYLTYNGAIIWDLTASPYVFDLTKGTTEGYGLRIEAANAPQVTTGVENGGLMNDANSVRKVIIDNKMYIITPEGAIFDVIGKKVQ